MKAPAYPQYKSSGQVWLGDVPAHWDIQRIKHSLKEKKSIKGANLACGAISFGKVILKDSDSIPEETRQTYQEVLAGEYLINPINLNYDLKSLRTALSDINVCVSPAYIVIRSNKSKVLPKYGEYLLHLFDIAHMKTLGAGVRQTITFNDIGNCSWCLPPLFEQEQIAIFLDRETIRIDTLIEKKTRFIELLKEKRQAVITNAVTRGLDPSVKMKDSGIRRLGEIPIHWETKAIKRFATVNDDVLTDATPPDYEIEYVEIGDVNEVEGIASSTLVNFSEASSRARRLVRDGDIIISTVRTYLRAIASVSNPPRNLVVSTGFAVLRPFAIEPDFARFALAADYFMFSVVSHSTGISYPAINASELMALHAAVPPREEQLLISEHIKKTNEKIDRLISATKQSIELLQEHRSALITAAVTGKVDVRKST